MGVIHFGTSGWRARTDEGFDEKSVGSVASALGLVWGAAADPGANAIYVGYDTRRDSERLALLVAGTLSTFGLTVHVSDAPCPTPALGRAVALDDSAIGAVSVTACDLPGEYGGIIVRGADGGTVSSSFAERVDEYATTTNAGDRGAFDRVDLVGPYFDHLASMVDAEAISRLCGVKPNNLYQIRRRVGARFRVILEETMRDLDAPRMPGDAKQNM